MSFLDYVRRWGRYILISYILIGIIVAVFFLTIGKGFPDLTKDNILMFIAIILFWPVWVWFIIVITLTYRKR